MRSNTLPKELLKNDPSRRISKNALDPSTLPILAYHGIETSPVPSHSIKTDTKLVQAGKLSCPCFSLKKQAEEETFTDETVKLYLSF